MTEELIRVPAGRLNGMHAEVGTLLGPKVVTREYVVVTSNDDQGLTVGYATTADLNGDALLAMVQRGPRSVTEAGLIREYRQRQAQVHEENS